MEQHWWALDSCGARASAKAVEKGRHRLFTEAPPICGLIYVVSGLLASSSRQASCVQ